MKTLNVTSPEFYKGYTIQTDSDFMTTRLIVFPTEQGIQHDYDLVGESYKYCGNCLWADSVEEAKEIIDELK